jgi:ATP-dependent Lhr-like helicase
MYEYDDRPDLRGGPSQNAGPVRASSLSDEVIAQALGNPLFRPPLEAEQVRDFTARLRRELPGWAPENALLLSEWVKERIAIPSNGENEEWERLLAVLPPELREAWREDPSLGKRVEVIQRAGASVPSLVHRERAKTWRTGSPALLARTWLLPWLRYEGPLPLSRIGEVFGFSREELAGLVVLPPAEEAGSPEAAPLAAAEALSGEAVPFAVPEAAEALATEVTVLGEAPGVYSGGGLVSDRENLELLLRLSRKKRRPQVRERPPALLLPFLARRQGLGGLSPGAPWEGLYGYPAPARLWETEFFPARKAAYRPETLDREIREGRLLWYGAGKERAGFCGTEDAALALEDAPSPDFTRGGDFPETLPDDFFDRPRNFWEIRDALGASGLRCTEALWREVWRGSLSADSWEPLRRALEGGFVSPVPREEAPAFSGRTRRIPRALRDRWRQGPPVGGSWFALGEGPGEGDGPAGAPLLEEEELGRDRVRLLLRRWGVLCRPLLEREAPAFSWSRLLPVMRRMELAGELRAGRFFGGLNSLQFAGPGIEEELEAAEAEGGIYWMNAADPASPAGLDISGLSPLSGASLPDRRPASRFCFRGGEPLWVSNRGGKDLEIFLSPEDPDLLQALRLLTVPRTRAVLPERKLVVERINGQPAASGVFTGPLRELGFFPDRGRLFLW